MGFLWVQWEYHYSRAILSDTDNIQPCTYIIYSLIQADLQLVFIEICQTDVSPSSAFNLNA